MNLLAFDTGTERMSIAVSRTIDGASHTWQHEATGGALASTGLIPSILDLLQQAQLPLASLNAICFGAGPGSFTGLRTACSVAQGLAFGANVPVLPMDSLQAVAQEALLCEPTLPGRGVVTALLDARMNELYAATYAFDAGRWSTLQERCLIAPDTLADYLTGLKPLAQGLGHWCVAGNVFDEYAAALQGVVGAGTPFGCITALPTARALLLLASAALERGEAVNAAQALPRYVRDKVAQTTQERVAAKAAPVPGV
jgi:tRNA threonylcarbamoyladenosine biosynthesis protein TsaB